jgi:hypothetical protein
MEKLRFFCIHAHTIDGFLTKKSHFSQAQTLQIQMTLRKQKVSPNGKTLVGAKGLEPLTPSV